MNDQEGRPFDPPAAKAETEDGSRLTPRFDRDGLVTAVVTDATSGELLMVAHMNDEALDLTIRTRVAHYWSRSRQSLWKKGETSGATQAVQEIRVDCDQDAIWLKVRADRPSETCHTHRASCFYRSVDPDGDGRALVFDPRLAVGAASDALRKTASPVAYDREHVAARLDEGKPAGSGAKPGAPEPSGRAAGSGADDEFDR